MSEVQKNTEGRYSERLKEIQRQREGAKEVKKGVHSCGGGSGAEHGSPFYFFIFFERLVGRKGLEKEI